MAIALITGASAGIGAQFARELRDRCGVEEFWFVARRADKMEALRDELGVGARILVADLCVPEGLETLRTALEEHRPQVRFLVNAAGFGKFGAFDVVGAEDTARMIDLNVKALVLITHMVIPYMVSGGRIIELGSGSCFTPLPHFNVYAASKSFVLHYTKALNFEIAPLGLRATCFCPGWVDTPFFDTAYAVTGARIPKKISPMLSVEKVVRGCVRAAVKGRSMYVTGWYTKLQHVLFKLLPDCLLSRTWLGMLKEAPRTETPDTKV